ncbi:S41 family peptidase [Aquimarina megaterium]|uniref:S41 family peptidase n=1 Tax=Aquimarina megaterium TaxID=1443666 RepID=UPI0011120A66|nr:S41 family peptidase [Aquimarina megaterium]
MKKIKILLTILIFSMCSNVHAQGEFEKKYSADSLKIWTRKTMKEVYKSHPGMYRYTSKNTFDKLIDSTTATISDALSTIEYYRKLKPLFAKIGCLHTSLNLSKPYQEYYETQYNFIPIEIFINSNDKVFITKNYSTDTTIPIKSEIISINKKPIKEVIEQLYKAIPSDGYNKTLKTLVLNYHFPFWYESILGSTNNFEIKINDNGQKKSYHLNGVARKELKLHDFNIDQKSPLTFEIKKGIGYLKIQTFSSSSFKKNNQTFKKIINDVFVKLKKQNIQNLIIDVRGNTGGSDKNAVKLASYFFNEPFQYWNNPVEISEGFYNEYKFWYGIFFRRPKKVDNAYQWKGMHWWLSTAFNYYKTQKPSRQNFNGNTYLIIDGGCMSSCADVSAILSHNKKVIVFGEETGGGYQGNTSGMMPVTPVSPNLTMTIPLQKYTNAVDATKNFGRGTLPDYPIHNTLKSWINKTDIQLDYVIQFIKHKL